MINYKAVRDFAKFTMADLAMFAKNVLAKMTDNPNFPDPDIPLPALSQAIIKFTHSCADAAGGGKLQREIRRRCRKELTELLRFQASYVSRISEGNVVKILSSGYHLSKGTGPKYYKRFWAKKGRYPGQIIVGCKVIPHAGAYVWEYSCAETIPAADSWIQAGVSLQRSMVIDNLTPSKKVWLRFCGVTWDGMLPWSQPIRVKVL